MAIKFKSINKHIIDGSTLMGFGLAVILLSLQALDISRIMGIWSLVGGIWFLLLGVYEIFISFLSNKFFED